MRHFAGAFGLLGFVAALAVGLMGEAQLSSVMGSAAIWGITFCILGYLLGKTALILLNEAGIPELPGEWGGGGKVAVEEETAEESNGEASAESSEAAEQETVLSDSVPSESKASPSPSPGGATARRPREGGSGDTEEVAGAESNESESTRTTPRSERAAARDSSGAEASEPALEAGKSEEIGRERGIPSGSAKDSPIEVDEASPTPGELTPRTPDTDSQ